MSEPVSRDYLDARFDGLEKLMDSQSGNLRGHIVSVSEKLKVVESDLNNHEKDTEAHGLGSSRASSNVIASWLGLVVAVGLLIVDFVGRYRK